MPAPSNTLKIAGLLVLGAIVSVLLWLYFHGDGSALSSQDARRYQALGQIGMPEIKKLAGDNSQIVFLRPAETNNPYDTTKLEQITWQQAADAAGLHLTVEPYASGTFRTEFFAILRKHPDAGVIIVDDLPDIGAPDWQNMAGKPRPKIIEHGADEMTAKSYLQAHLIDMAFVYRPQGSHDSKIFQNDQECFDYYYKILTP